MGNNYEFGEPRIALALRTLEKEAHEMLSYMNGNPDDIPRRIGDLTAGTLKLGRHYKDVCTGLQDMVDSYFRDVYKGLQELATNYIGPLPAFGNPAVQTLTKRQIEVLELTSNGLSNREIARQLIVSENTIKFHMRNIRQKINVPNKIGAVLWYIQFYKPRDINNFPEPTP